MNLYLKIKKIMRLKKFPGTQYMRVEFTSFLCGFSYFPIGLGGGFHDYARTKNPGKSPYQWINPKNVTSIYKSTLCKFQNEVQ